MACGGAAAPDPLPCDAPASEGLTFGACPQSVLRLRPVARAGGAWIGGGLEGECSGSETQIRCPSSAGELVLERDGDAFTVSLIASGDVVVEALGAEGPAYVEGAGSWISNGFHSWSQSGALAIGDAVADAQLMAAIAERGDTEVLRDGRELSWSFTVIGGGGPVLLAGATTAARLRPWAQVSRAPEPSQDLLQVRIASGGVERVSVASGETLESERFVVLAGGEAEPVLRDYASRLDVRERAPAEVGWNSWYELWDRVDEPAMRANAARARALLEPHVPPTQELRIVIDDGWQRAWGDWYPNDKFPSGLDGLATDLRADGFAMGVWLAPLLAQESSEIVAMHPEYFVQGASYAHAKHGNMRILDVTRPEAAQHLRDTIARIVSWGYSLLKIDFLFAGTFEGTRSTPVTGMEAFHLALSIIREAAGQDTLLLTVGAPDLAVLPYSDAWRAGGDIALEPFGAAWAWIPNQTRVIAARYPFCLRVACDADPVILRTLPPSEVEVGAWTVAFAGGGLFLSDDLRVLDDARVPIGLTPPRVDQALAGEPAVPVDYLPASPPARLSNALSDHARDRSSHVVPRLWRLSDGRRVGLNVSDDPIDVEGTSIPARSAIVLP